MLRHFVRPLAMMTTLAALALATPGPARGQQPGRPAAGGALRPASASVRPPSISSAGIRPISAAPARGFTGGTSSLSSGRAATSGIYPSFSSSPYSSSRYGGYRGRSSFGPTVIVGYGLSPGFYGDYGYPLGAGYGLPPSPYADYGYPLGGGYDPRFGPPQPAVGYYPGLPDGRAREAGYYDASRPAPAAGSMRLEVRVPAGAEVWFDGTKTVQTGAVRRFHTPPLAPGGWYAYEVRVRWREGGKEVTRAQTLRFKAGEPGPVNVDFTGPAGG